MRKLALTTLLVASLMIVSAFNVGDAVSAESVLKSALENASDATSQRIGDTTWLEDCGIAIQLPPAPPTDGAFPRLLAGESPSNTPASAALWELGPEGLPALQTRLERDGASFQATRPFPFRPRLFDEDIAGHRTTLALEGGRSGQLLDWTLAGRNFAILTSGIGNEAATRKLEELVREMGLLKGIDESSIAPMLFDGRYAFHLEGWQRGGSRFYKKSPDGWFSLRTFRLPLTDFERLGDLQNDLEAKLLSAGFRRSDGNEQTIAGTQGTVGEYFGSDGFIQRIAYARLDTGYLLALMQAPEGARVSLRDEMAKMAGSVVTTGIGKSSRAAPMLFNRVRNIRCLAWQDGQKVLWGVLYDDGRQNPIVWREDDVTWAVSMDGKGEGMADRGGKIASSRTLNPLVDAESRALPLPKNFKGEVELTVNVGGEKTTTRLTIK